MRSLDYFGGTFPSGWVHEQGISVKETLLESPMGFFLSFIPSFHSACTADRCRVDRIASHKY